MLKKDPLNILNLQSKMSRAEILSKAPINYKKLSKIYHPDNKETGNTEIFMMIKQAFDDIMNVDKYYELIGKTGRTIEPSKLIDEIWNSI